MKKHKYVIYGTLIFISSFFIVMGFITISHGLSSDVSSKKTYIKKVEIKKDPEQIKSEFIEGKIIISEVQISNRYLSILTSNMNNRYESAIIDKKTSKIISFTDLITPTCKEKYWDKIYELLELKYPKFIVDEIKTGKGRIIYDAYSNQVKLYFYDYSFTPSYTDTVSLTVNYNEINSYLNFAYQLDDKYQNEDGYKYTPEKKTIALTFDDGPSGEFTKEIVDTLIENKAKATFFMVGGRMAENSNIVKYVHDNGMEIGSHTYNHVDATKITIEELKENLRKTNDAYKSIIGEDIKLFRPPYGLKNNKIINQINYPFIIWNVDPMDWKNKDSNKIVNHILNNACDGCIVLIHDIHKTTKDAVKILLPELYAKGYQIVDVSTLANLKGKTLENHKVYGYIK